MDRYSKEKDKLVTTEKGVYLTVAAKCPSDSGSDLAIANKTKGIMSLGVRNTRIHTAVGTGDKVIEDKKLSLLDERGVVQNIQTQSSDRHIGPDRLKGVGWYHQAFQQLGVPKGRIN